MANDTTIRINYTPNKPSSGAGAIYTQIDDPSDNVWNGTSYQSYTLANYATYATATPESPAGSGRYSCQFPTSSAAGNYSWTNYLQTGVTPTLNGVVTLSLTAGGSGYTNGTGYALTFTGGSPAATAVGTFDVSGGAVTALHLTNCGAGYASAPTPSFTGAGSGTGAAATATLGSDTAIGTGTSYWSGTTFGGSQATLPTTPPTGYGNLSGTGSIVVNQDYGGTGNLSAIDATGKGIGGATVTAFLTSDYNANGRNATPLAQVTTTASGQWQTGMLLSANQYTMLFSDRGYLPNPVVVTVA